MKMTIEVDCTPEEARRAIGLPDLTPIHERYLTRLSEAVDKGAIGPEMLEAMMKSWSPMTDASMAFWRKMFPGGTPAG